MDPLRVHLLYDVEPYALTLCKQGANRKRIFLKKEHGGGKADVELASRADVIRKAEGEDWSYFYCVVAEPGNLEDAGVGDGAGSDVPDMWRSADEIRKAAHFFARSPKLVNGLHDAMEPFGTVVENAIAQSDFSVLDPAGNAQVIKKDSWYVGIAPTEEGKSKIDAGEFTGISLEGTGYRDLQELRKSDRTLWERFVEALGGPRSAQALAKETGTVDRKTEEELDVSEITELKEAQEEIRKEQSATSTAITKLSGLVEKLVDHQVEQEKRRSKQADKQDDDDGDGAGEKNPADLKKSIDELTESVNSKLDELDEAVSTLAAQGSTQHTDPDNLRKESDDESLAFLLD